MLTVNPTLLIWAVGLIVSGLGAFLSFAVHLLINNNKIVSKISTDQQIFQAEYKGELSSLRRHAERNSQEVVALKSWQDENSKRS